jgi:hypothetical protein
MSAADSWQDQHTVLISIPYVVSPTSDLNANLALWIVEEHILKE